MRFICTTHARPVSSSFSTRSAASATNDGSISGGTMPRISSATMGVSVKAGQSALSRIPREASPGAAARTRPTTACFVAAYTGSSGAATSPASDAVATIEPPSGISRAASSRTP